MTLARKTTPLINEKNKIKIDYFLSVINKIAFCFATKNVCQVISRMSLSHKLTIGSYNNFSNIIAHHA